MCDDIGLTDEAETTRERLRELAEELVDRSPDIPTVALVSRLMPYNTGEVSLDVVAEPTSVASIAKDILEEEGRLLAANEYMPRVWQLKGVIGAGWSNMTPAIVTILISEGETHHTHITIQGKAKEFLIRQHAEEKGAQRIAQQLKVQLPG
jgi:hypothetical protein